MESEQFVCFGPDTPAEARNRGYRAFATLERRVASYAPVAGVSLGESPQASTAALRIITRSPAGRKHRADGPDDDHPAR